MREIVKIIKADIGLEIACIDLGDWDTHEGQGGADGWQAGDLAITTDYRTVLSEIVEKRLKNPKLSEIFPGFGAGAYLGVFDTA